MFCYYIKISIINHEQCLEFNNQQIRFRVDTDFNNGQKKVKIYDALSRLEYSDCGEALVLDRSRCRNRECTPKLRSRKFLVRMCCRCPFVKVFRAHLTPYLRLRPGSGPGVELLGLSRASCFHDPSKRP